MKLPFLFLALVLATLSSGSRTGWAQNYPTRQVTMIVPYAAGGPTDVLARVLAEKMRAPLGQAVIVENVPGGGGSIGVGRVARAAPDGYTIDFGNNGSNVLVGALYALPFDLVSDFKPVAELTTNPQIIISKKAIPARNFDGIDNVAQRKSEKSFGWNCWSGGGGQRDQLPRHDFHATSARAISRSRTSDPRSHGRAN